MTTKNTSKSSKAAPKAPKAAKGSKAKPEAKEAQQAPSAAKEAQQNKPLSGLDAAYQVLKEAGQPMKCKDIVEKMLAQGLWTTNGKTPSATLYSAMLREIDGKPEGARFVKTGRGLFGLAKA